VVACLLPGAVWGDRIGAFFALLLAMRGVPAAPFLRAVPAYLAVFSVRFQFLRLVFAPPPLLTTLLTANHLERLVLRGLKSLLTIAATPFSQTGRYRIPAKARDLETDGEYLPCLRRFAGKT
jgi:hypothetical protein